MNLNYLGHDFTPSINKKFIFNKFLCNSCNVLVFYDSPYVFISAHSKVLCGDNFRAEVKELKLSCNEVIIRGIIK